LSGQISPYCEKKRHWLCAYCAPLFLVVVVAIVSGGIVRAKTKFEWRILKQNER